MQHLTQEIGNTIENIHDMLSLKFDESGFMSGIDFNEELEIQMGACVVTCSGSCSGGCSGSCKGDCRGNCGGGRR